MYYVMSIPEVLVLLFVLLLWMISIFFCYKRYEKINTIERADMPNMNLKNANQSMETQSYHSLSKNNVSNSGQNINQAVYPYSVKENHSFNETNDAFAANNSIFGNFLEKCNEPNYPSLYFIDETNANASRIELISYQKCQKYRKYHQNFNIYSAHQQGPRVVTRPYLSFSQFRAVMGQSLNYKNTESQALMNNSKSDNSKNKLNMSKSSSEPVLKELLIESRIEKLASKLPNGYLTKSNSICNENLFKSKHNNARCKLSDKRSRLMYNNKSLNDDNLIDPQKIPRVIQKSLIDLHKRSMWNLSHKPQINEKTKSQSKNALNFLHLKSKNKEINSSHQNVSRVITQMKNGNEIKMKINDNSL